MIYLLYRYLDRHTYRLLQFLNEPVQDATCNISVSEATQFKNRSTSAVADK